MSFKNTFSDHILKVISLLFCIPNFLKKLEKWTILVIFSWKIGIILSMI